MNWLKRCFRFFSKRLESRYLSKYYLTIHELPAVNLIKIYEDKDLTPLSRTGKICHRAPQVLERIEDEIVDTFGVSKEFKRRQRTRIELELLYSKMTRTGDRSLLFEIQMLQKELKEIEGKEEKTDLYAAMAWIKMQGIDFKENEITVFWYYKYMDFLSKKIVKENEALKNSKNGRK